ncbi:GHKL domain-containing protein [Lysinibacillus sp. FSL M8-0216]|uniref:GHKL domain-containing protein n=1 Tax=Lysinibacillus fusiformis TaxID=28031 RepID=A0A1H8YVB3_9BACI|nr:GHKL domain-containing protein [Lysinibacillus fusiformis]EAZ86127.1 signal transduction histidine kinase regulating citrate/malate metabolism [Bacillus sp. B14905]MCG7434534.1 GHKL domain-containing protein [Lysinibacillus fusiformis]MED4078450.1 GHKL domain-containing protein [Lysinibacillus fusiformis]NOG27075.1 GHKL domain-containing protein [Lysinibacillus fusiformis]PCD84136.1 histidine kinase [Lysinibacillus fusiformis]
MKNRKIKLILILSTILLCLFTSLNIITSYVKIKKTVEESIANQSLEAANSIAASIDTIAYQQFLNNPQKNDYYWEVRSYLNDARVKLGALFVYTLQVDNPKVSKAMVMGLPSELKKGFEIGEVCTVPAKQVEKAYHGETYVTEVIHDSVHGSYLSVGAPIKDDTGQIIGYLGIDISADTLNGIKGKVIEDNLFIFIFNGVFILIVAGSFLFLQRWYQKEVAKEVGATEDTYQAEIKTLITSVSSLRHDFTNHIQVLHGLLQLEKTDQAKQYLASLSKEVQAIKSLKLNIDHPGLSILLQTKKLTAQNHNIDMDFTISQGDFNKIKTTDLIKILSNLIDNAIDAANELPEGQRKIMICCQADEGQYEFKITNTGPNIVDANQIFKQGFSTKKHENGKIRGQGLFIVKEIVHKYHGDISIESSKHLETTAIVHIPFK